MTERKCPNCGSKELIFQDSHKEYVSVMDYNVIKYYACENCEHEFAIKN